MLTLTCSNLACDNTFKELKSVSPDEQPKPGDIVLCGQCSQINVLLPNGFALRPITDGELSSLDPDERKDLDFAVRNIQSRISRHHGTI